MVDHEIDSVIEVLADDEGTPLDFIWRRRLKDAEIDQCCEVVNQEKKSVKVTEDVKVGENK